MEEYCYELCPHCESEVKLPNELGVYQCPVCGQYIVNCSMCKNCDNCSNCVLSKDAKEINRIHVADKVMNNLIDMISNKTDTFYDNGISFNKWVGNGEIFESDIIMGKKFDLSNDEKEECLKLSNEISPIIDEIFTKILKYIYKDE